FVNRQPKIEMKFIAISISLATFPNLVDLSARFQMLVKQLRDRLLSLPFQLFSQPVGREPLPDDKTVRTPFAQRLVKQRQQVRVSESRHHPSLLSANHIERLCNVCRQ